MANVPPTAEQLDVLKSIVVHLLEQYDPESGCIWTPPDPGCPVCTAGTTPDRLNTGLCVLHKLEKAATGTVGQI